MMTLLSPLAVLAALSLALPAQAAGFDPAEVVQAEILPGWQTKDGQRMAGLRLVLAPGWHTYWRAPGDAGIAPSLDLSGSQNLAGMTVHWPVPQVFDLGGMHSIGYEGTVVLPLELALVDPGQPLALQAEVELGVCEQICVPVRLQLRAELPRSGSVGGPIAAALADRPVRQTSPMTCKLEPIADGMRLTASLPLADPGAAETAVIEVEPSDVWVSTGAVQRSGGQMTVQADLVPPQGAPFVLDRSTVRLTLLSAGHEAGAVEVLGCAPGK